MIIPCILVLSFEFDFVWSTRYFPVYHVSLPCLVLPWCPAWSSLNIIIWVYVLAFVFLFLPRVCTVTEDQTQTVSGAHSPRFVFRFQKSFVLFQSVCLCLSRGREVASRNPAIAHCKMAWEFGGIATSAASPLAAMPADRGRYPPGGFPSSRAAAPPGAPFAGDHATGPPLTLARRIAADSCPPDHRWLKPAGSPLTHARRITADSSPPDRLWLMPAGSPLTQARRIAADSSLPDRRWLKPTGLALTHARWPPLFLAPWIKSTCYGQECRFYVVLCPQEHFNLPCLVMSCTRRLVWGRRLLLLWPWRPF